jgi:CDP-diglyceride synthetase
MKNKVKVGLLLTLALIYCLVLQYFSNYIFDAVIVFLGLVATNEFANLQQKSGYPGFKFNAEVVYFLTSAILVLGVILGLTGVQILLIILAFLIVAYFAIFGFSAVVLKKKLATDEFRQVSNMDETQFSFFKTNNTFISVLYPAMFMLFLSFLNHIQDLGFSAFDDNTSGVNMGLFATILLFAICCLTDTFAMLFGMLIKGKKLCPKISPNKTISGAVLGLVGGVLGAVVTYLVYSSIYADVFSVASFWQFLIVGLVGAVIAEVGDLFESFSKRRANVKDSGDFFRSHGGVLDRLDSVMFTVPVVFVSLIFIFG